MTNEIPQWVVDYNNANHQSSAGKAIKILMDKIKSLEDDLKGKDKALLEAKWFVDHVMGNEKRVDWGKSFNMDWERVNTAMIEIHREFLKIKF